MLNHNSVTKRKGTPHANSERRTEKSEKRTADSKQPAVTTKVTKSKALNFDGTGKASINDGLRRRSEAIIKDRSIDAATRAIIRYGLETNDPWLPDLVRRVDAGETIFETIVVLKRPKLTPTVRMGKRSKH